jgi:hypothetical protein
MFGCLTLVRRSFLHFTLQELCVGGMGCLRLTYVPPETLNFGGGIEHELIGVVLHIGPLEGPNRHYLAYLPRPIAAYNVFSATQYITMCVVL